MILYHGSNLIINEPNLKCAKRFLDFGPGFYLTSYENQAQKWAHRKAMRSGNKAFVNSYELATYPATFQTLQFVENDKRWLDYVCACRKGEDAFEPYDIVIGGVANDDVFRTIDMYLREIWDLEKALSELRFYMINDQVCILNQTLLDNYLTFIGSYEVLP